MYSALVSEREYSRLVVKGLGPIAEADVALRPLTLILGENNTGKSWLASVIWGLESRQPFFTAQQGGKGRKKPRKAALELESALSHLDANGFVRGLLGEEASVELLQWMPSENRVGDEHTLIQELMASSRRSEDSARMLRKLGESGVFEQLLDFILDLRGWCPFLPAPRTGFMLAYPALVGAAVHELGPRGRRDVKLTRPMASFVQSLARQRSPEVESPYKEIADFLVRESSVDVAPVIDESSAIARYQFKLEDGRELPVHLGSSLATEVAPILLTLRAGTAIELLVLEEPESHMHPRMQRVLARVVCRLVRAGVRVVLTSHSENFCQQLSNLVKLGSLGKEQRAAIGSRFGYTPQEYLLATEVAAYELCRGADGRTRTQPLDVGQFGIATPSFNSALLDFANEVGALDDAIAG